MRDRSNVGTVVIMGADVDAELLACWRADAARSWALACAGAAATAAVTAVAPVTVAWLLFGIVGAAVTLTAAAAVTVLLLVVGTGRVRSRSLEVEASWAAAAPDGGLSQLLSALTGRPGEVRVSDDARVNAYTLAPGTVGDRVLVTSSLRSLPAGVVAAVLAHEAAHVRRGDPRALAVAETPLELLAVATSWRGIALVCAAAMTGVWGAWAAAVGLAVLWRRQCETLADLSAVEQLGDVAGMLDALAVAGDGVARGGYPAREERRAVLLSVAVRRVAG